MTNKKTLLALTFLAMSASAEAYFDVNEKEVASASTGLSQLSNGAASQLKVGLTQIGVGTTSIVKGRVIDTRISDSLPLLIPKGWRVNLEPGLSSKLISWEGGRPWAEVLDKSLRQAGLAGEINWLNHQIRITNPSAVAAPVMARAGNAKTAPKTQKVWQVSSGKSINDILKSWTAGAGWHLESDVELVVMADVALKGTMKSAVKQFIDALNVSRKDSSPNSVLKAKFYGGNNYLRVWEESK